MRGIGKGQTIELLIVPEIQQKISQELAHPTRHPDDAAAWLQLNGLRLERMQYVQLCVQDAHTVFRHAALDNLLAGSGVSVPGCAAAISKKRSEGGSANVGDDREPLPLTRFHGEDDSAVALRTSIEALCEDVDDGVSVSVAATEPLDATLRRQAARYAALITTAEQRATMDQVLQDMAKFLVAGSATRVGRGLDSEMTKEKEREQESQKLKQTETSRGTQEPPLPQEAWAAACLLEPVLAESALEVADSGSGEGPFWALAHFTPRAEDAAQTLADGTTKRESAVPCLAFRRSALQSVFFCARDAPESGATRLLKNVSVVLAWAPPRLHAAAAEASGGGVYTVAVSLEEAEALRRLLHDWARGAGGGGGRAGGAQIALVSLEQMRVLEASPGFADSPALARALEQAVDLRFLNSEMHFADSEVHALLEGLGASAATARLQFFEGVLACRRRAKPSWAGTPVRHLFSFGGSADLARMVALVAKLRSAMAAAGISALALCEEADRDGNGYLEPRELRDQCAALGAAACDDAEIENLCRYIDVNGDHAIDYEEFVRLFDDAGGTAGTQLLSQSGKRGP